MPGSEPSGSTQGDGGLEQSQGNAGVPGSQQRGQEQNGNGPSASNSGNANAGASGQRDSSTGDLGTDGQGGQSSQAGGGGDYSLDTLPDGAFGGDNAIGTTGAPGATTGATTASERIGVLDEQLRRGYEVFDGIVLNERERAQADPNANAGGLGGLGSQTASAGGFPGAGNLPQTLPGSGQGDGQRAGGIPASNTNSPGAGETFPPPEDIPSGRDDDVVARQIREAAMREPDPELREAMWEEYRAYTGISE